MKRSRWQLSPVLIFTFLLLFNACTSENLDVVTEVAASEGAVDDVVSEERSPLESSDSVPHGLEETAELLVASSLVAQPEKQVIVSEEWLGATWGFEQNENCLADNNLLKFNFPDFSICDLQNFKFFFERFSEDYDFQISVTKFPLKRTDIFSELVVKDGALKEIKIEKITCFNLPQKSSALQLFPVKEQREFGRFKFSYTLEGVVAKVKLQIEDTGYCVFYIFTWDRCWMLSEIEDSSM